MMAVPSACGVVMLVGTDVIADVVIIQVSEIEESGSLIDDDLSTVLAATKASILMRKSKASSSHPDSLEVKFARTSNKAVVESNVVVFVAYSCMLRGGAHYYLLLDPRGMNFGLSDAVVTSDSKLTFLAVQSGSTPCTEYPSRSATIKPRRRARSRRSTTLTRSMARPLCNETDVATMKKTSPRLLPLPCDRSATEVSPLQGPFDCLVGAIDPEIDMLVMANDVEEAAFVASPSIEILAAFNHEMLTSQFNALADAGDHEGAAYTLQAACTVITFTGNFCGLNLSPLISRR
jgi:hypothetical protein